MAGIKAERGKRVTGSAVVAKMLTITKTSEDVERYLFLINSYKNESCSLCSSINTLGFVKEILNKY